jgi:hypothetical protein
MKATELFQICNSVALCAWVLLIIFPQWKWTKIIIVQGIIPLLLGMVYLTLIILFFGVDDGDFNSLEGVMKLFTNPWTVTAGWVHYLAFDLFIGSWQVSNCQKLDIKHYLIIPSLLLTFFFGPIGLLLYFLIRAIKTGRFFHENF